MTKLRWKLTQGRSWANGDATVDACEWIKSHDHVGEEMGHYLVKFSYRGGLSGQVNQGEFCHKGIRHIAPYTVGERLAIQYDIRKPSRHHFSGVDDNYEKLEAIVVMAVFALIAGYFLYAF